MSGLEIAALIAGTIGAGASSVSAYKDAREKRSGAVYKTSETVQYGDMVQRTQKVCATSNGGDAGIKSNGDMYATSRSGGSATAMFSMQREGRNETQWVQKR